MSERDGRPAWLGGVVALVVVGLVVGATQIRLGVQDDALDQAVAERAEAERATLLPCAARQLIVQDVAGARSLVGSEVTGTARLVGGPDCAVTVRFVATHDTGPPRHGRSRAGRYTVSELGRDE